MTEEDSRFKNFLSIIGGLTLVLLFFASVGLFLKYGVAPALEFISNLVTLTPYYRGVADTLLIEATILLILYLLFSGPTMRRM